MTTRSFDAPIASPVSIASVIATLFAPAAKSPAQVKAPVAVTTSWTAGARGM